MRNTQLALLKHQTLLARCRRCPRMQSLPVIGTPVVSKVLLVGQAPGSREGELKKPFAWTAGKMLFKWFETIGVNEEAFRGRVYMAAVCRCFPGKKPAGGDRVPDPDEVANCASWLDREIEINRPALVIPVGKLAIAEFLPVDTLDAVVGKLHRGTRAGVTFDIAPLPHPSGASTWQHVEPGKTLLRKALKLIACHPAWMKIRNNNKASPRRTRRTRRKDKNQKLRRERRKGPEEFESSSRREAGSQAKLYFAHNKHYTRRSEMKNFPRALCTVLAAFSAAATFAVHAAAADPAANYPNHPIRYLVAFAPGGINDIMARIVAERLNQAWGQPAIVDNRPGAGGNLAAGLLARTNPDGYTFMNISTAHAISQTLYTHLDYSLERDLTPVVVLGNSPLIMVVNGSMPVKNVAELVSWAKTNPLRYASGGVGVISHLSMEMFKTAAKIQATHVPFKGVGPAVPALMSGECHVMINAIPELLPYTRDGKLRVIASLTEKRHPMVSNVPTMIEQGYKEFVMGNWTGIVAPAKTPPAITHKLAAEITHILRAPEMTQKLTDMGVDTLGGTPEEFGQLIHAEVLRFGKAVKESGAKAD